MYKTFAKHLLAIAFVIYLIAAVITALLALAGGTVGILLAAFVSVVAAFCCRRRWSRLCRTCGMASADLSIGQTVNSGPAVPLARRREHRSWPASRSRSGCS